MYTVYVLRSDKDNNLYIEYTSNLEKRLDMHNLGLVRSTKGRKPLKLIYHEVFGNRYDAFNTERLYKTAKGKKILKDKLDN